MIAPWRLPRPPKTTTIRASSSGWSPAVGEAKYWVARNTPATPAIAEAKPITSGKTRLIGTPIRRAASRSWATARIAIPYRERFRKSAKLAMIASAISVITIDWYGSDTLS